MKPLECPECGEDCRRNESDTAWFCADCDWTQVIEPSRDGKDLFERAMSAAHPVRET